MRGFTLVELLVVMVVIGCLGAIAVPSLFSQVNKTREAEAINYLRLLVNDQKESRLEKGDYEIENLKHLSLLKSNRAKYFKFDVDPSSSSEGVFIQAAPKSKWATHLKSYFAAIILIKGNEFIEVSIICRSKSIIGKHLKKSDLYINSKAKTLTCRNNAEPI